MMKAKRGDLIVIIRTELDRASVTGSLQPHQVVTLATVAGITRDGRARTVRDHWLDTDRNTGTHRDITTGADRDSEVRILPTDQIDTVALYAAWIARRYPTAPDSTVIPPMHSEDEFREFARQFRIPDPLNLPTATDWVFPITSRQPPNLPLSDRL